MEKKILKYLLTIFRISTNRKRRCLLGPHFKRLPVLQSTDRPKEKKNLESFFSNKPHYDLSI